MFVFLFVMYIFLFFNGFLFSVFVLALVRVFSTVLVRKMVCLSLVWFGCFLKWNQGTQHSILVYEFYANGWYRLCSAS